ncbi:hypothetical protein AXG93_1154s1610 [Marchantia polymorpha subsp. ruderalis]|uniref:Uncharacterized protein n=1 Tax=Marchantia polymorpha subsp. ruderalis TaxID=1480154 RepID=A0A176WTS6_MARPO|nr:hypothetical protein AXG93_1154s1610 [Marchantia polymorpha subsp. ruderalis]
MAITASILRARDGTGPQESGHSPFRKGMHVQRTAQHSAALHRIDRFLTVSNWRFGRGFGPYLASAITERNLFPQFCSLVGFDGAPFPNLYSHRSLELQCGYCGISFAFKEQTSLINLIKRTVANCGVLETKAGKFQW